MRIKATSLTFSFGVVVLLIAILARATAVNASGAWFSPGVSTQFYSITILGSVVLALGLAALASHRAAHMDGVIRAFDRDVTSIRRTVESSGGIGSDAGLPGGTVALDEVLASLELVGGATEAQTSRVGHDSIVDVPALAERTRAEVLEKVERALLKQRTALRGARDRVWPMVAGPIGLAIAFVAISATMLPGVEGFLVTYHDINTMFILMIGYSWWLLVAWAVLALASLPTEAVETKRFRPRIWERVD